MNSIIVSALVSGYTLQSSLDAVTAGQFRFPRSKRKRMRKKWAGDERNWKSSPACYVMQQTRTIVAHPAIANELEKLVRRSTNG